MKEAVIKLLEFIISQKMDLKDYGLLGEGLKQRFSIRQNNQEATQELIETVVKWENDRGLYDSLENVLLRNFTIEIKIVT